MQASPWDSYVRFSVSSWWPVAHSPPWSGPGTGTHYSLALWLHALQWHVYTDHWFWRVGVGCGGSNRPMPVFPTHRPLCGSAPQNKTERHKLIVWRKTNKTRKPLEHASLTWTSRRSERGKNRGKLTKRGHHTLLPGLWETLEALLLPIPLSLPRSDPHTSDA